MEISINGQKYQAQANQKLEDIINQHKPQIQFAVAYNGCFIPQEKYTDYMINNNDEIEIVTAHPGG